MTLAPDRQTARGYLRTRRGFTLIEVLIVIAIIAVLLSILFPALGEARRAAVRIACASNMRQIGIGLHMYADRNNGRMPESTHTAGGDMERTWIYTLAPYIGNVDTIRVCPADPNAKERIEENGTSYVLNEYFVVPKNPAVATDVDCLKLHQARRPSAAMLLFIISDRKGTATTEDHTHSRNWFKAPWASSWSRVCADISPGRHGGKVWDGTKGSSNYLFADGHVETISAADLWGRTERVVKAMDPTQNFARPE